MIESRDGTINIEGTQQEILTEFLDITENIVDKVLNVEVVPDRAERVKLLFDAMASSLREVNSGDVSEEHS